MLSTSYYGLTNVVKFIPIATFIPVMITLWQVFHVLFQAIMLCVEKVFAVQFNESKDPK